MLQHPYLLVLLISLCLLSLLLPPLCFHFFSNHRIQHNHGILPLRAELDGDTSSGSTSTSTKRTLEQRFALPFMLGSVERQTIPDINPTTRLATTQANPWKVRQIITHQAGTVDAPFATQVWSHEAGPVAVLLGTQRIQFYYLNEQGLMRPDGDIFLLPGHVCCGAFSPWLKYSAGEVFYFAVSVATQATIPGTGSATEPPFMAPPHSIYLFYYPTLPLNNYYGWHLVSRPWLVHPYLPYDIQRPLDATWGSSLQWGVGKQAGLNKPLLYVYSNRSGPEGVGGALFEFLVEEGVGQTAGYGAYNSLIDPVARLRWVIADPTLLRLSALATRRAMTTEEMYQHAFRGFGSQWCVDRRYPIVPELLFVANATSEEWLYQNDAGRPGTNLTGYAQDSNTSGYVQIFVRTPDPKTQGYYWGVPSGATAHHYRIYAPINATGFGSALCYYDNRLFVSDRTQRIYIYPVTLGSIGETSSQYLTILDPTLWQSCGVALSLMQYRSSIPRMPYQTGLRFISGTRFLLAVHPANPADRVWSEIDITRQVNTDLHCLTSAYQESAVTSNSYTPSATPPALRAWTLPTQGIFHTLQRAKDYRTWFVQTNDPFATTAAIENTVRVGRITLWYRPATTAEQSV